MIWYDCGMLWRAGDLALCVHCSYKLSSCSRAISMQFTVLVLLLSPFFLSSSAFSKYLWENLPEFRSEKEF